MKRSARGAQIVDAVERRGRTHPRILGDLRGKHHIFLDALFDDRKPERIAQLMLDINSNHSNRLRVVRLTPAMPEFMGEGALKLGGIGIAKRRARDDGGRIASDDRAVALSLRIANVAYRPSAVSPRGLVAASAAAWSEVAIVNVLPSLMREPSTAVNSTPPKRGSLV